MLFLPPFFMNSLLKKNVIFMDPLSTIVYEAFRTVVQVHILKSVFLNFKFGLLKKTQTYKYILK